MNFFAMTTIMWKERSDLLGIRELYDSWLCVAGMLNYEVRQRTLFKQEKPAVGII
jgi:hypothetical protein